MQNALFAGLLAGIACGIIGCLVVVNRIVFITGGIAHATYGGIGLAIFLGISPFTGGLGFSLAVAIIMALISLRNKRRADTVIGVLWAIGMAVGIIFIDLSPGYNVDLMSYLFGSILAVPRSDIWLMLALDIVILGVFGYFYKRLVAMSYDDEYAALMGVPVKMLYILLLALIAISVVVIMRVVGLILVIALFTISPYIAEKYSRSLKSMILVSVGLNMTFTLIGLWLSYTFNLTSGAVIILVAGFFFLVSLVFKPFQKRKIREQYEENPPYLRSG
ncbi:metal ABC transporter permease [Candidatus Sumerlaeota bacterium]|nr:metal ABC transporter permease [Candidatus Sumerlaeota bacterium]